MMNRRVIIIGKTGQLARALMSKTDSFGCQIQAYGRDDCDLSSSAVEITAFAQALPQCDGIILAAAYTAVDDAENNPTVAFQVNGTAPAIFAQLCRERSIPFVHVSTDYVFSGDGDAPIRPDMPTCPINTYGQSKLAGETEILAAGARAVILRTSWVFDGTGKNFLTTMLRLGETRDEISVVADQLGRPTYAGHLAQACWAALSKLMDNPHFQGGIYHVSGAGEVISWADFAKAIFAMSREKRAHIVNVIPVSSSEYLTPAKRPSYSVLDMQSFEREFDIHMPDWQEGLKAALVAWQDGQI